MDNLSRTLQIYLFGIMMLFVFSTDAIASEEIIDPDQQPYSLSTEMDGSTEEGLSCLDSCLDEGQDPLQCNEDCVRTT